MNLNQTKITIPIEYKKILLESIEDEMYKVSLSLDSFKGKPLTKERKMLTKKQSDLEKLQHIIHSNG